MLSLSTAFRRRAYCLSRRQRMTLSSPLPAEHIVGCVIVAEGPIGLSAIMRRRRTARSRHNLSAGLGSATLTGCSLVRTADPPSGSFPGHFRNLAEQEITVSTGSITKELVCCAVATVSPREARRGVTERPSVALMNPPLSAAAHSTAVLAMAPCTNVVGAGSSR
jgi:hypothetical protein